MHFLPFLWSINYNYASQCNKSSTHSLPIWLKIEDFFSFLWNYGVVYGHILWASSCISEWKIASEIISRFDIDTNEDLKPWQLRICLEVDPPWVWYYRIFLNFLTLVILLQVDLVSGDEPKTVCEGYYETKDTFIFAWFSIVSVGHYRWLCGSIP
jgi:hypothetical protein